MGIPLRSLAVLPALVAALALPAAAHAAKPVTLGAGHLASVDLDAAGTAHIAWLGNEPLNATLQYCRLPLGATACDRRLALPASGDSVSRPYVTVDGATVRVLQHRYGLTDGLTPDKFAAVFLFTSRDGGASFDRGAKVGTVPFVAAVRGPGGAVSLATHAVTEGELYQRVPVDGSSPATTAANLSTTRPYVGAVGLLDASTPLVVFADASGNAQFRRYTGAGDVNNAAAWTPARDIGYADWAHLAGGPSGLFLLATRRDGAVEVRRFAGDTFGPGVKIPDGTGETPQDHLAQDPGGMLHVLLPQITASCCPLLYAYSSDGTRWTTVSHPQPELAAGARGAFLADHRGVAVWHSGTGPGARVLALRLGPRIALRLPATGQAPATARVSGGKVVVKIKGRLRPPRGVPAADVCGGRIAATVKKGKAKLASRAIRVSASCSYGAKISIPRSKVGSAKALRLDLAFRGSRDAKAAKRGYRLKLRR